MVGLHRTAASLEIERTRHDADRERTFSFCDLGHYGCCTGAGATTFAGGDEHHVGASEMFLDFVTMCFGCFATNFGVTACTETAREFATDVDFVTRITHDERLCVGIDRNKVDAAQTSVDHAVDGVDATTTDTHHFDDSDR